ncbi:hypothetical protein AcW1_008418 [Taiwanofungus camphoratus]|nr:hypothetical protein AcV5_008710 [Antrodia cinnamomea]KAI0951357.1 hypothetical protein AcW1_008418 [Antrodia cinnamomea]KAI0956263.1 hypothetical protein AcV7_006708 [Antrodia cinnamomea]
MVSITVSAAGRVGLARGLPITVSLPDKSLEDTTVADVKAFVAAKFPKFYVSRQKISLKGEKKPLSDVTILKDAGVVEGGELTVKDLGPQIGWRTVYLVEYAGPLIIHPLIYHYPKVFYGGQVQHSTLQKYVYVMVLLHFLKREAETLFVHRFSHGTMPFFNIFKNSGHYWVLSGVALAYAVYSPTYSAFSPYILATNRSNPNFLLGCVGLWMFAELSNLHTHLTLRTLRPAGTTVRAIPHGYGFSVVSYPNYFFESLSWVAIAIMTGSYAAWLFVVVGTWTMAVWAVRKHRNYKKEFGKDFPSDRKAIFPFIL